MDFLEIGKQLRKLREKKGLSYDQIYEITRIHPDVLQKIENGGENLAPAFLKAFIRTYATCLSFDVDGLFQELSKEAELEKENKKSKKKENKSKVSYTKNLLLWGSFSFFFCLIVAFYLFKEEGEKESTKPEPKKVSSQKLKKEKKETKKGKPNTLFEALNQDLFKKEILIKSGQKLKIYFKLDGEEEVFTQTLKPDQWFLIKAKNQVYLRLEKKKRNVEIYHDGKAFSFDKEGFLENTF